jgi:arylsulfatase A-like enzyme
LKPRPATEPRLIKDPIVLLLTIDAFRADLISDPKYEEKLPTLHRLKRDGIYFSFAHSPSPQTAASIAAIFSGRTHSQLRWSEHPLLSNPAKTFPHEDPRARFPELLAQAGTETVVAASTNTFLNTFGLARGFTEEYLDVARAGRHSQLLLQRVRQRVHGPLFWWGHFLEPHAPYAGNTGSEFERYLQEVAVVDRAIARMLAAIDKARLTSRTVVIVTGDHGEAFGEHNTYYHATTLYEELLRVPLLVLVPGLSPRIIERPVSGLDLGPTILDLFGLATPASFMGESFVPLLLGREFTFERPLVAESGRNMRAMFFDDGKKLIVDERNGTLELYDLKRDPKELENVFDAPELDGGSRLGELRSYFDAHEYRRPGYKRPFRP